MATPRSHTDAVSTVLGDVLLIGITVSVAIVLSLLVAAFDGPSSDRPANIAISFEPGTGGWGTGDEYVVMSHRGGMSITGSQLTLRLSLNGTETIIDPPSTAPFADGRLTVGESWNVTGTMRGGTVVRATLVNDAVGSAILAFGEVIPPAAEDCSGDTTGPYVSQWGQIPLDLESATPGAVTVEIMLDDNCAGVNFGAAPDFNWRIDDGNDPPWTTVTMAAGGGNRFTSDISEPAAGWESVIEHTLAYQVLNMQDLASNSADSNIQTDTIQGSTDYFYARCPAMPVTGTVAACPYLQASGDGQEAELTESLSLTDNVQTVPGTTANAQGDTESQDNARGLPNNDYAVLPDRNDRLLIGGFSVPSGPITGVQIMYEGKYVDNGGSYDDDYVRLRYRLSGSQTGSTVDFTPSPTDTITILDVSGDRTWTLSNIANLQIDAQFRRGGPSTDGIDIHVDAMWLVVTTQTNTYHLTVDLNWTAVPAASAHTLEMRYRSFTDTFDVQVWNGAAFETIGTPLTSTISTTWPSIDLTLGQMNGGEPIVRFVDRDTQPASSGALYIDYLRIRNT